MSRLLLIMLFFVPLGIWAQELTVTGKVTGHDSPEGLPGVSVVIKGTTNGTITDFDGNYSVSTKKGDILVFSFVGMKSKEVTVADKTIVDVVLAVDTEMLSDVVVIGYGTQKKEDVTGSVTIVGAETIENLKPVKVEQALQGTVAGVNVTAQSGAPGAGLNIRIRGISTNGDASPIAIIDGYEGDLGSLNPSDIETITVLKDAQAAIYGTRGANGVILVTTKKGKKGQPTKVSINSSYGLQETSRIIPVLNATEYAVLLNESYAANGQDVPYQNFATLGQGTNWQKELFQQAPMYSNDISITGSSDKSVYSFSASDLLQDGIVGLDKTGYRRSSARASIGTDLYDWLKLSTTFTYTNSNRKSVNDFGLASVLFNALNMPSTVPVYNESGDYSLAPSNLGIEVINPLAQVDNTFNEYNQKRLNGNFALDFTINENITATTRVGFNSGHSKFKEFFKEMNYGGKVFDVTRSSVNQNTESFNDYTFEAFVNYKNTFAEVHNITATIGTSVFQTWGEHLEASGYDVPNNSWDFADISLAPGYVEAKSANSWTWDQRRLSYFARIQYDYMSKYLVSAIFRRDASTKFGPDKAAAFFPSATLGWKITEEEFLKDIKNIDALKLRVSYGLLGSDKIDDYIYISQLSGEGTYVVNNALVNGTAIGVLPNAEAQWEQSEQFDIGTDMSFFNHRLEVTADYFIKNTNELLIANVPVSAITGVAAAGAAGPTINAGSVRNSGFELAIRHRGSLFGDLKYDINYNFTTLKNEVTEVNNGTGFVEGGEFGVGQPLAARMEVGQPIGYFYGYKTDGIFQTQEEVDAHPSQSALGAKAQPGDIRFVDTNNDGVLNADDRTNIGDPIPDVTMGLNISLQYRDFDFVAYTFASIGNEKVRNYERVQPNVNKMAYMLDRWTGPGTSTEVPRVTTGATANNVLSDFYVEDASFVRLQNVQLGYTLPKTLTEKVKISKLRLYAGVNNLLTITNYKGYDPAASNGDPLSGGFDFGFYPAARTYLFGLNLNF